MTIIRHHLFLKHYKKRILPFPNLDKKFEERFRLFIRYPSNPVLHNHKLIGTLEGFRSFSITGDIRVVYRTFGGNIELYDIGSHNQIY
ncbi:MAG: type II toxin-antitoxin system YafQ family toxin [Nanoarchaeota archaeon]|nr:type II toxin-antitoxin system YafQ family toxin [Nanoarchaeota archaeon]